MKTHILICSFLFLVSCSSSQTSTAESKIVLDVYLNNRLNDEKCEIVYVTDKVLGNVFMVDALESAQMKSRSDDCILEEDFCIAKHFLDNDIMNHYYSQFSYNDVFVKNQFSQDKVVLINWEHAKEDRELLAKAFGYAKSISRPLISKDGQFSLVIEKSNRNGCVIFFYKKMDGKWVELDSITTCLI